MNFKKMQRQSKLVKTGLAETRFYDLKPVAASMMVKIIPVNIVSRWFDILNQGSY